MTNNANRVDKLLLWSLVILLLVVPAKQAAAVSVTTISSDASYATVILPITTDGIKLYFGVGNSIDSTPLAGGAPSVLYGGVTCCNVLGLTTMGSNLYWTDPNGGPITDTQISTASSAGGGPVTHIYTGSSVGQPIVDGAGLTTDGTKLYTSDEVQGRVHSLNPDGSAITLLGSRYSGGFNTEHYTKITQTGGVLYVVDAGGVTPGGTFTPGVFSISTSGGAFATLFSGGPLVSPDDIAVGNGKIYLTDEGADTIWQLPLGGGTPTPVVSGGPFVDPRGLTFLNNTLYVTDPGAHAIFKVDLVPEPSTWLLLGTGLIGLLGYGWRRSQSGANHSPSINGDQGANGRVFSTASLDEGHRR